jgi:GNAT superfamily N-acetyltransferase
MGRLEVRVTPADVGKRVSVRRLNEAGDSGARFTDTVGLLTSWDEGVLTITRRTGEQVRIGQSTLVAGKVVPAAVARRRGPSASYGELAGVVARAWQPVERARLGDWELRAAVRDRPHRAFTRRANSVLPLGDPGVPLDEALTFVRDWYARRGLHPYIQTADGAPGAQELLGGELQARGWVLEVTSEVRTAPLTPLADAGAHPTTRGAGGGDDGEAAVRRVRLSRSLDEGWLRRYGRTGADGGHGRVPSDPGPQVRAVLAAGPSVWFASVPDRGGRTGPGGADGEHGVDGGGGAVPVAVGRLVVDGRWAGFSALEVAPQARRQGLATAVTATLARRALAEGASAAWLQVESDNAAAGALYDGMGFEVHHVCRHYRG